jgi:hypothetical protein
MKRIYTIVPIRNFKSETLGCLKGLVKAKVKGYENKVIIVDNASSDGSSQEIAKAFPSVQIIRNKKNHGFAPAINQGVRKALKDKEMTFILQLNNDTRVPADFLQKLVDTAVSDRAIGITAPALRHYQKETLFFGMEGKLDLNWAIAKHRNIKTIKSRKIIEAQFVSGCCMLIKREVLEKAGLMDERFFLYLDDVDYCLTVQKAGYKTVLDPGTVIDHKVSASFGNQPLFKLPYSFKSNIIFILKWTPLIHKPLAILRCLYFYPSLAVLWSLNN